MRRIDPVTGEVVVTDRQRSVLKATPGADLIAVLVDNSWSMMPHREDVEAGVTRFVADHADADLMIFDFSSSCQRVWGIGPAAAAGPYRMSPAGGTALFDSAVQFINEVAEAITDEEVYRPVTCVIATDGQDVSSKKWTRSEVRELIGYWSRHYRWRFVFLGAGFDAVKEGVALGVPRGSALTFDIRRAESSFAVLSRHVAELRAGNGAEFTPGDRRKALGR